jgi:hypothetical protein
VAVSRFLIDSHVHIYPFHDLEWALNALFDRLSRPGVIAVACLTERFDCDLFYEISEDESKLQDSSFSISQRPGPRCLLIESSKHNGRMYLIAGQQIVTGENLEILGLNIAERIPDSLSAGETIDRVLRAGGTPVVAWGFGKWLFSRSRIVRALLEQFDPCQLVLGDTSMRPIGWLTPLLFRVARRKGFRILHGSDPLPHSGEEKQAGSYCSDVIADTEDPQKLIEMFLLDPAVHIKSFGRRGLPWQVARRLLSHSRNQASG